MNNYAQEDLASTARVLKALANENRLQVLHWLTDPLRHFPPQQDGDRVEDGICVGLITEKIGLKQPTVTSHMKALQDVDLVTSKKIKNWVFYKLNDATATAALETVTHMVRFQHTK